MKPSAIIPILASLMLFTNAAQLPDPNRITRFLDESVNDFSSEVETNLKNDTIDVATESKDAQEPFLRQLFLTVIDLWTKKIHLKDYQDIIEFATNNQKVFKLIFAEVLKKSQGSDEDIINILDFLNQLPHAADLIDSYNALYHQMKENEQVNFNSLIRMAYQVKRLTSVKESALLDELPPTIRAIVNGNRVIIQCETCVNYYPNKGLSMDDRLNNENGHVKVIYRPSSHSNMRWYLEPVEDNGKIYFFIRSENNHEYLYAARDNHAFDESKRRVFTLNRDSGNLTKENKDAIWDLQDSNWMNGTFYIRNVYYNEYLNNDDEYRVYTWRNNGRGDDAMWIIQTP